VRRLALILVAIAALGAAMTAYASRDTARADRVPVEVTNAVSRALYAYVGNSIEPGSPGNTFVQCNRLGPTSYRCTGDRQASPTAPVLRWQVDVELYPDGTTVLSSLSHRRIEGS